MSAVALTDAILCILLSAGTQRDAQRSYCAIHRRDAQRSYCAIRHAAVVSPITLLPLSFLSHILCLIA